MLTLAMAIPFAIYNLAYFLRRSERHRTVRRILTSFLACSLGFLRSFSPSRGRIADLEEHETQQA